MSTFCRDGFHITDFNLSKSKLPSNSQKNRQESISDEVIFFSNIKRHLGNYSQIGPLFHQALLVVTSKNKNENEGTNFEYHIVEYMDDSNVHHGKIIKDNNSTLKNLNDLKDLRDFNEFDEYPFNWVKMEKMNQFEIDALHITVEEIRVKMQKIADEKGKYDFLSNNCQQVADKLTKKLWLEEISKTNVKWLAYVTKTQEEPQPQPHSALLVAVQNYKYYIVEYIMTEVQVYQIYLKNQTKNLKDLKNFEDDNNLWTKITIVSEFYYAQTVPDIVEQMKFHGNTERTFNKIQSIFGVIRSNYERPVQENAELQLEQQSCQLI